MCETPPCVCIKCSKGFIYGIHGIMFLTNFWQLNRLLCMWWLIQWNDTFWSEQPLRISLDQQDLEIVLNVGYLYLIICKDVLRHWDNILRHLQFDELNEKFNSVVNNSEQFPSSLEVCPCCFENVISVSRNEPNQWRKTVNLSKGKICETTIANWVSKSCNLHIIRSEMKLSSQNENRV